MESRMTKEEAQFAALRETYNQAFHHLAQQVRELQSLMSQPATDERAVEEAKRRVEQAQAMYHESRDLLAWSLLFGDVKGASATDLEALARTAVIGVGPLGRAGGLDHRSHVEQLAHQLWEQAGRPSGKAEEHWYLAERLTERLIHLAA
jgi:hypothetical protein